MCFFSFLFIYLYFVFSCGKMYSMILNVFLILDQPNHVETNLLQPAPPLSLADNLHSFCHVLGPCVHRLIWCPQWRQAGTSRKKGEDGGGERKESHLPVKSRDPHLAGGERSFLYLFLGGCFSVWATYMQGGDIIAHMKTLSIFAVHRPSNIQYVLWFIAYIEVLDRE